MRQNREIIEKKQELLRILDINYGLDKETNDRLKIFLENNFVASSRKPFIFTIVMLLAVILALSFPKAPEKEPIAHVERYVEASLDAYSQSTDVETDLTTYTYDFITETGETIQIRNVRRNFDFGDTVTFDIDVKNIEDDNELSFPNSSIRYVETKSRGMILEIR